MLKELLSNRRFLVLFALMFSIVSLLNVNYCLLRSARNALAVTDLGKGAGSIPIFELCGSLPASILMVYLLTRLLNRFSIHKVFLITLAVFSGFFLLFAAWIHPSLSLWTQKVEQWTWLPGHLSIAISLPIGFSMLFFVMAELWKIALLTVLFWGLVNQYIPLQEAKKCYAPLMFGGSLGAMIAGPLTTLCTSQFASSGSWSRALILMMIALTLIGVVTAWLYTTLWKNFSGPKRDQAEKEKISVRESVQLCLNSRYLLLLAWITVVDYIAYALGEVIFFDVLKQQFPDPRNYCAYMGQLSFWSGLLTAFSALVVTPYLIKRFRWVVTSLVTPMCLLLTQAAFFISLWSPLTKGNLPLLVFLGSTFFCLVRAAKYTLFDTSKEISFLLLPPLEKMQGKLVIDGICSRLGRGGASFMSIILIELCGGVVASSGIVGLIVLAIGASCLFSTLRLGTLVNEREEQKA